MPKVSVIIPVYNSEKYIKKCIDSFLNQHFSDFELLVIDDGSKDKSVEIVKEIALSDNRVRLIRQANSGVSSARNRGIEEAKGKYITFCDSDDYVGQNHLSVLVDLIESSSDCQMSIVGDYKFSDETGRLIENAGRRGLYSSDSIICQSIDKTGNHRVLAAVWNKLFITKIIKNKRVLFNTSLDYGEDWLFVIDYLRHTDRVIISDVFTYYYRVYDGVRLSTKYRWNGFENAIYVRKIIAQWLPDKYGNEKLAQSIIDIHKIYQTFCARKMGLRCFIKASKKFFSNQDLRHSYLTTKSRCLIGHAIVENKWYLYCFMSIVCSWRALAKYYILKYTGRLNK